LFGSQGVRANIYQEDDMVKSLYYTVILVFGIALASRATIINIPADYPSIQQGIDASVSGDTVLVQPGTYYENINFNGHNIVLGSLFLTTGDPAYISSTIIDGNASGPVILLVSGESDYTIIAGFTIQNGFSGNAGGIKCSGSSPQVHDNYIINNETFGFGGGAYADANSFPSFRRNLFAGNWADWGGGGLYIEESQANLMQNIILRNGSVAFGGGVLCNYYTDVLLINNTFDGNAAYYGGGLCYTEYSYPIVSNSIFWDDSTWDFTSSEVLGDSTSVPTFTYCDIENTYMPGAGNIDIDPLFRNPAGSDFHLMSTDCGDPYDSPCIDAGDPGIADSLLNCAWGLGGMRSDMGAYGGWDSVQVGIVNPPTLPGEFILLRNYPNPFNAQTTIEFFLPEPLKVRLTVYDLLGRQVRTLLDEPRSSGVHKVIFDASDLTSGVYFCRLRVGNVVETKRMVLLR